MSIISSMSQWIVIPNRPPTRGRGPIGCHACGIKVQLCRACQVPLEEGEQVAGCESGVHLHPKCFQSASLPEVRDWAFEHSEARRKMCEYKLRETD